MKMALARWLVPMVLAGVLAACGGGSSASVDAPAPAEPQSLNVAIPTGGSADPIVTRYELLSSTRVARTVYDYTFRVTVESRGNEFPSGATLTVNSSTPATVIQDGAVVTVPLAGTGAVTPADTFTIRQDRTVAFSAAALSWTIIPTPLPVTGLRTIMVDGEPRTYYLDLPSNYDPTADALPLIIAYHGTGGSYAAWYNLYKLKEQAVHDDAILIYPDARPNAAGVKQWDFADDFRLFEELLEHLPEVVKYDPNRILVTGHSSGGGFAHEVGCRYGNRIRAIAPDAGSLTATTCVGSVAVLQIQGRKDSLVPIGIATLGRNFWVGYNGFDLAASIPGVRSPPCLDYSLGASPYPVQWCAHTEGDGVTAHAWPSFANTAIWQFFTSLPVVAPRNEPPDGGGNARAQAGAGTTLTFTLRYPPGIGTAVQGAAVLGTYGARQPLMGAPLVFLNLSFPPAAVAGDEHTYTIPIQLQGIEEGTVFPVNYSLEIVIYVQGGGFPIPAAGVDHVALVDIAIPTRLDPIVIPGVLDLEVVRTTP